MSYLLLDFIALILFDEMYKLCCFSLGLDQILLRPCAFYREVLIFVVRFTALSFTATGAPPAAGRICISPKNQYACWPNNFRCEVVKIYRSQEVLKMLSFYTLKFLEPV
jgi:hypothetical protein